VKHLWERLQTLEAGATAEVSSAEYDRLLKQSEIVPQTQLVPFRTASAGEAVPPHRVRLVSPDIIEHWRPVPTIWKPGINSPIPSVAWWEVTQRRVRIQDEACHCVGTIKVDARTHIHAECGRRVPMRALRGYDESYWPRTFGEHVKNVHIAAMRDDDYNMFYPTIPGNDVIHFDRKVMQSYVPRRKDLNTRRHEQIMRQMWRGSDVLRSRPDDPSLQRYAVRYQTVKGPVTKPVYCGPSRVLRGGCEIRHGRREWREKTKNMIVWDEGTLAAQKKVYERRQQEFHKRLVEFSQKTDPIVRRLVEDDN
jgi:hypothetical protein